MIESGKVDIEPPRVIAPAVRHVGASRTPIVVIDRFSDATAAIVDAAAALAPFPAIGNYYPGLRRLITARDAAAADYVRRTMRALSPVINRAFAADGFFLVEASFSMVTAPPDALAAPQRVPHFDSIDPDYLAVLHYLSDTPGTGTAFYRQRATGIELVDARNLPSFVSAAERAAAELTGYTSGSNDHFDEIGRIDGERDRLIVYPSRLLHSGVIPPDMAFDDDPRRGRLTANFFVKAKRPSP